MPENIQMICLVRLIVAAVCGLLIGVERQTRMKGAGSRTHMMVSLGAALMTLVSSYGFLPMVEQPVFRLTFLVWRQALRPVSASLARA